MPYARVRVVPSTLGTRHFNRRRIAHRIPEEDNSILDPAIGHPNSLASLSFCLRITVVGDGGALCMTSGQGHIYNAAAALHHWLSKRPSKSTFSAHPRSP